MLKDEMIAFEQLSGENAELTSISRIGGFLDGYQKAMEKQQWIPCSERLPPELKPVNVTWINRQPPTYYEKIKDNPFTDTAVYYEGKWYWQSALCVDMLKEYGESPADDVAYGVEIVAWMPLPEPYKGGDRIMMHTIPKEYTHDAKLITLFNTGFKDGFYGDRLDHPILDPHQVLSDEERICYQRGVTDGVNKRREELNGA